MKKILTYLSALFALGLCIGSATAQFTPPPAGAYISNGSGGWTAATTTDTAGQVSFTPPATGVYCYNSSTGKWVPATSTCLGGGGGGAPSGPAGGDLSGTYPNPAVKGINSVALSSLATGLLFNTTTTGVPSTATAAQVNTVIQGLTGCNTATNVYVPQGGTCVAPSSGSVSLTSVTPGSTGAGDYNFSGATQIEMPILGGGAATSANGQILYNSNFNTWHLWNDGVDTSFILASGNGVQQISKIGGGVADVLDIGGNSGSFAVETSFQWNGAVGFGFDGTNGLFIDSAKNITSLTHTLNLQSNAGGITLNTSATGNHVISNAIVEAPNFIASTPIAPSSGGTGVANTATHTLGSSNQNWASLGTGIVKNTTTTGAISDAASADVTSLWTGTCNSSSFLRGDGACAAAGGLPTGTTGQTIYYAAGGTAGTATSATTTTSASAGFPYGIGMAPITNEDVAGTQSQIAPYTGTVTLGAILGATATSATLSGGTALNANGGYVIVGYQDGSNDQEIICYSAATSTTMTIGGGNCGTPVTTAGRSYFGTTAASHANGSQVVQLLWVDAASITAIPRAMRIGNGGNGDWAFGLLNPNTLGHNTGEMFGNTAYFVSATGTAWCLTLSATVSGGDCAVFANGSFEWTNGSNNAGLVTAPASLDYAITTQGITGNGTLTAITNAKTPTMPNNNTTAAAGAGGVLSSHCTIIWNQATSGTVGFGVKASAAPTDLWVKEQDQIGTALAPIFTTITSTTTTATSGTVTPTAFGTTYASDIWLAMNPGTSNSVSVQLYAQASANTITIEPGTGCTAWQ